MADRFNKQAKLYAETRPCYPPDLFEFIASKTPNHDLAWDVGTGSGQAAFSLAKHYKNIVGTDTSEQQLAFAFKHPNIRYQQTPPNMLISQLECNVAAPGTVDLVTVATAIHWFDLPTFYSQVNHVLSKPNGVLAVWCYTEPQVTEAVDAVFSRTYNESAGPYWTQARKLVDDEYRSIDFPFAPVDGLDNTGPIQFWTQNTLDLDGYLRRIRTWSAYQNALEKGVDLLKKEVVEEFERAWSADGDGSNVKTVRYPVFLRIGRIQP